MNIRSAFFQPFTVAALVVSLIAPPVAIASDGPDKPAALTENQKILHVLNRLGYGVRPGDVEKVKAMGVKKYIDAQINAVAVPDTHAEEKVKHLEPFGLSTSELFAKYPNPAALLRQLEGGRNAQAANQQNNQQGDMTAAEQRERRQKLQALYREYDLKPANQLIPQIVSNRVLRAVYSERQLQEVMVDFWQNHFNVFAGKAAVRWYVPSYERDVLRKNALGNFKDLLVGTAQHPAMLFYLDNFESVSPTAGNNNPQNAQRLQRLANNPRARARMMQNQGITEQQLDERIKRLQQTAANPQRPQRGINENYARELMELHTLGVDGGYTQADIIGVAKAFTGWTIADARGYRRSAANMITGDENRQIERLRRVAGVPDDIDSGEFYFNERVHDRDTKIVLGQKISEGGIKDGLKVIDILANHPNTAKHIARKLAVKFVSDAPSDAYVGRIADAFQKSKGDIKATLSAMFHDKEFFAPQYYRAKIKSPFELAISSLRALGGQTNSSPALIAMLNKLGEVPYAYQAPTGYPDTAEDWVNTGALLERLNFAVAVASNRIPGTTVDLRSCDPANKRKTLDQAIFAILNGEISDATKNSLVTQLERPLPDVQAGTEISDAALAVPNMRVNGEDGGRMNRQARLLAPSGNPDVFKAVSLVLGSPEFQRQ